MNASWLSHGWYRHGFFIFPWGYGGLPWSIEILRSICQVPMACFEVSFALPVWKIWKNWDDMTSPQVDILSPPYGPQIFPLIPYRAEVILMKFPIPQSHYQLMQVDPCDMQLWQQILISVLSQEEAKITFPDICQNCRGKMLPSPKKDQRNPRRPYPWGWRMLQTNWGCRLCPWGIGQQCRGPSRFSMIRPFFPYHREKQYFLYDKNIIKN